ncbi:SDR family NAD(P)-dependent oxidoreductase [Actinomadura luteofluorescens]|uniref:SDR family NAD(P)-dependent oxidoreductase n=1 Tax=Actinomadura luteofluorescens TaxID=46163 RepID=UPI003637B535
MGTYLITGATGGIGTAVAELLRERGHDLLLTGRSAERLDKLAATLRGARTRPRRSSTRGRSPRRRAPRPSARSSST